MTDRAPCPVCGKDRQVLESGTLRSHRRGTNLCAGSKQPPALPATAPATSAPVPGRMTPEPPDEPTYGRSCDGGCDLPSVGWRLFRTHHEWLPVCGLHMDGPAGRTRIYDAAPIPMCPTPDTHPTTCPCPPAAPTAQVYSRTGPSRKRPVEDVGLPNVDETSKP